MNFPDASPQVNKILSQLQLVKRASGNSWKARCPAHDDRFPSLSVSEGTKGAVLHCHAGCPTEAILYQIDLKVSDLFYDSRPTVEHKAKPTRCERKAEAAKPKEKRLEYEKKSRKEVCSYDYRDESGELLFKIVRYDPKDFQPYRPHPTKEGVWIGNAQGVRRVLFRLPELIDALKNGETVFVVEGEADVLTMEENGLVATTSPFGVGGGWLSEFNDLFTAAEVIVIADKDEPGRKHAESVARNLQRCSHSVRIIELPDTNGEPVKDARDYFSAGGTVEGIKELINNTAPYTSVTLVTSVTSDTQSLLSTSVTSSKGSALRKKKSTFDKKKYTFKKGMWFLARSVIGLPVPEKLKEFSQWFDQMRIENKVPEGVDKDQALTKYLGALKDAKVKPGDGAIQKAWTLTNSNPIPSEADVFTDDAPRKVIAIGFHLEQIANGKPWFLPCRAMGELLGVTHNVAADYIRAAVGLGVFKIVTPHTKTKGTRYRWTGETQSATQNTTGKKLKGK
jgi:hypothetical protein